MDSMSKEQIENWRKVLLDQIGPYALIMPDEEIQKIRDSFQGRIDEEVNEYSSP